MKKTMLFIGVAALAACAETATEEAAEENGMAMEDEMAMEETSMATAPDGGPVAGTYEVTNADGESWTTTINADMTYSQTMNGEEVETGTMRMQDNMTACFDPAGEEEGESCSTSMVAEDGTWTASNDEGEEVTVVRVQG